MWFFLNYQTKMSYDRLFILPSFHPQKHTQKKSQNFEQKNPQFIPFLYVCLQISKLSIKFRLHFDHHHHHLRYFLLVSEYQVKKTSSIHSIYKKCIRKKSRKNREEMCIFFIIITSRNGEVSEWMKKKFEYPHIHTQHFFFFW